MTRSLKRKVLQDIFAAYRILGGYILRTAGFIAVLLLTSFVISFPLWFFSVKSKKAFTITILLFFFLSAVILLIRKVKGSHNTYNGVSPSKPGVKGPLSAFFSVLGLLAGAYFIIFLFYGGYLFFALLGSIIFFLLFGLFLRRLPRRGNG